MEDSLSLSLQKIKGSNVCFGSKNLQNNIFDGSNERLLWMEMLRGTPSIPNKLSTHLAYRGVKHFQV